MDYIPAKTIVNNSPSPAWFGVHYNMNIYRGCSFGCIYCDSRSLCYKIENFEKIRAKHDALCIIRADLLKKRKVGVIATGAMSDPYNPYEKELKLTQNALELINAYGFGVAIATKSDLISRDVSVLKDIQSKAPVIIKLTLTTVSDKLAGLIEPHAPSPSRRLAALKTLTGEGLYAGILMMPILPFITDNPEAIIHLLQQAKENGARFIYPSFGVTLRAGNRDYFYQKLDERFSGLKQKYINRYGQRYSCQAPNSKKLWQIFSEECQRLGLYFKMADIITDYKQAYRKRQLSLFVEEL
ncbi:MAG: radical SAM protein [Spirochaetaceae bacterium]|nr:radical SAM protein [Spirochaetaceae bacterium]